MTKYENLLISIRDDLILRAKLSNDNDNVVNLSDGLWERLEKNCREIESRLSQETNY